MARRDANSSSPACWSGCRWPSPSGCCSRCSASLDGVFGCMLAACRPCCPHRARGCSSCCARARPRRVVLAGRPAGHRRVRQPTSSASGGCASGDRLLQPHPDRQVDLQLGQAGVRHAVLRAAATPSARRCWCSSRAPAPGPSPSSPARPAARWRRTCSGDYVSVYVPTTPNPTSGFFLMVPRATCIELDMSVDEALKYIISMGVVAPPLPHRRRRRWRRARNRPG